MTSHIDCDELLALAACSVDEQLNADLRNQLCMSLAQVNAYSNAYGHTPSSFAPATTPTATSFHSHSPTPWISDDSLYVNPHHVRMTRESSVARAGARSARFKRIEDPEAQDEGDNSMQIEQDDMQPIVFSNDSSRVIGKQPDTSEPVSLFATSDPFYLAVKELQQTSRCRRQLQPKLFSVNTPLQVTPNPVKFGTLNTGVQSPSHPPHTQYRGMTMASPNPNGYDPLDRRMMPLDASLMQYR